jgi:small subunit ribosomal protein S14
MAKESMKAREVRRQKLVDRYAGRRAKLKAEGDYVGLSLLPRNSNPSVCIIVVSYRQAERIHAPVWISRITFREMASKGLIPGIKKASW